VRTVDTFVDDEQGAIIIHNEDALILRDGRRVDVEVILVMRVTEGLITSVAEFMDLRPVAEAFGSSLDT
jgi:ketosteroid isomerase-like protein